MMKFDTNALLDKMALLKLPAYSPVELERRGRFVFILIVIVIAAYALVGIFYDLLSMKLLSSGRVAPVAYVSGPVNVLPRPSADFYAVIVQKNLFGSTDKAVAGKGADESVQSEGPDISTTLEVKGIIAGTGKDGFAVIEEKGSNKQALYKVGSVVSGAKLVKIMRNAVTFLVNGRERQLKMPQSKEGPLIASRPALLPEVARSGRPTVISRDEVSASLRDMGTMLSQAQIRPYYSDGAPDGFMITNIKPGSLYERIGLMDGDIIQGADDHRLLTADDVTALYNSLKAGSTFALKIKRRGQQENLQYVFR